MPFKFNPFTGNFDQTGSGGGGGAQYIDGEVATYADLPLDGTAALNSAWLVREASGVWPVSRKQAGIYIRTATGGVSRDADFTYAGTMPDVFSDAVFTLYDEASTTRTGQFNLGSVTAGQNRVLTWPNANGTIALTSDIPSSVTSVTGTAPIVSSGGTTPAISIQNSPTLTGDVTINGASTGVSGSLKVGNTTGSFNRDVEIGGNGIVLRNVGGSGTTTIALGQGSTSSYTLTPPAASGTIALTGHTHAASDITSGTIDTARLASGTANSGTFLRGDQTWSVVSGVTTGSVDNAVLRADGTGGSTSQSSAFVIADNATASPNNTVNHASIQATGGTTNVSVSIVPKGTGALSLHVPDATSTGGNARGVRACDFQRNRSTAAQVASGDDSFIAGGNTNTASGANSFIGGGIGNVASGSASACVGSWLGTASSNRATIISSYFSTASQEQTTVINGNSSSATQAYALAIGPEAISNLNAMIAEACGGVDGVDGGSQHVRYLLFGKTTTNAAVELLGGSNYATRFRVPSGKVIFMNVKILGVSNGGGTVATFQRQYALKNVSGTTSQIYAPVTIGTDNAESTSVSLSADDTNDSVKIECTGLSATTIRWVAHISAVELSHG